MNGTPDETKKWMDRCARLQCSSDVEKCPWECGNAKCIGDMLLCALALIHQLEAERDQAVADMKNSRDCQCCKHYDVKWDEPCVHCDNDNNYFEWRGVHKEDSDDPQATD